VRYLEMKPNRQLGSGAAMRRVAKLCNRRPSRRFGGVGEASLPDASNREASPPPSGGEVQSR